MKGSSFVSLALASLVLAVGPPVHPSRPHYGGTLRVEMAGRLASLEPAMQPSHPQDVHAHVMLVPLVFETLVRLDASGRIEPLLARSWQSDAQARRWEFTLRPGVRLHDGTPLTTAHVARSLKASAPFWNTTDAGDRVVIETDKPAPALLWELTDPRLAIVIRDVTGVMVGTGPFRVGEWRPEQRAVFRANEDHWAGRPFLDAIQVEMGRPLRDQVVNLETGRADFVGVLPQDVRRLAQRGVRLHASRPRELVAVVCRQPASSDSRRQGQALSLAVDRAAIAGTLLQGQAEAAAALIPAWLSGYDLADRPVLDRRLASSLVGTLPVDRRAVAIDYDAADPVVTAIAERVAADAREVGLTVRIRSAASGITTPVADVRILRLPLDPTMPERAMLALAGVLGLDLSALPAEPSFGTSGALESLARFERQVLTEGTIVPLVHLPEIYATSDRVETLDGRVVFPWGGWSPAETWLRPDKP